MGTITIPRPGGKARLQWPFIALALWLAGFVAGPAAVMAQETYQEAGRAYPEGYAPPENTRFITAAVPRNWPPHYTTDDAGQPDGFAIEAMQEIARIANVSVRYVPFDSFRKAIAAVEERKHDIVPNVGIAGFRREHFDFTAPVETFVVSAFVRTGSLTAAQLSGDWLDVLRGRTTAVITGNLGLRVLKKHPEVPVVVYENVHEALIELIAGRVDAFAYPQAVVNQITRSIGISDKIEVVETPMREVKRGVAVRNDDADLHLRLSYAVDKFVASPAYERIYTKWFGDEEAFWTPRRLITNIGIPVALLFAMLIGWRYFSVITLNRRLRESRQSLSDLNSELECRVRERTLELAAGKDRLEDVLDSMSDGIIMFNRDQRFIYCNDHFRAAHGALADILKPGLRFEDLTRAMIKRGIWRVPGSQAEDLIDKRNRQILDADGSLEITGDDGRTFFMADHRTHEGGTLITSTDITDRKRAEKQLLHTQKMDALGSLAGGVAHSLNNLLVPILALNESVTRELPPESRALKSMDMIAQASARARDLVSGILAFSRQEDTRIEPQDLHRLVTASLELMREAIPKTTTLINRLNRDIRMAPVDRSQIESVIMNLLGNAAFAIGDAPDGRIEVSLDRVEINGKGGALSNLGPGWHARLSVIDNGSGIDADIQSKIFDPFFTTKRVGEGAGMGLAMAHGIAMKHGGDITVSSTLGKGSTFEVYLPLEARD